MVCFGVVYVQSRVYMLQFCYDSMFLHSHVVFGVASIAMLLYFTAVLTYGVDAL